jgi:3-methyl-2-oxobutanoate hydroxymethyltransferase
MARIVDQAGIDVILVGDSATNVMAGHRPVPVPERIYIMLLLLAENKRALVVVGCFRYISEFEAFNSALNNERNRCHSIHA